MTELARNGQACDWVAVHDGARPLVSPQLISRGLQAAQEVGAAIAALPAADTIKVVDATGTITGTPERSNLWIAQTPQVFRTDLLDASNAKWPSKRIDDYAAAEVAAQEMWSPYAGKQPGDPEKLGQVLVTLADMETPPRVFLAGSDAIAAIAPALEARLKAVHALEQLSKSTDGNF